VGSRRLDIGIELALTVKQIALIDMYGSDGLVGAKFQTILPAWFLRIQSSTSFRTRTAIFPQ
jgi:hypothetical protein